jgi:predicted PurR-regulated permease PerM
MGLDTKNEQPPQLKLDIPALTFIKIFVALLIAFALVKLAPLILLVLLSALTAFAISPAIEIMEEKKVPRSLAMGLVIVLLVGSVLLFIFGLLPQLFSQLSVLVDKFGPLKEEALSHLPEGPARQYVGSAIKKPSAVLGQLPSYLATIGAVAVDGLWSVGVFVIVTIYFLLDGARAYEWFLGFFKPATQSKLNRTTNELQDIVSAYVGGQVITSLLVAAFAFIVTTALGIPGALLLAAIAAVFDVLPIIGILAATFCAALMALTVSPQAAIAVVAFYFGYHALETYVIVPRVYGHKLKLSTLVVMVSFLFAGSVAGICGALLVLPLVASYPVIEKIWLRRYLGQAVVENHLAQAEASESALDAKQASATAPQPT